jgi:hypothetical protein
LGRVAGYTLLRSMRHVSKPSPELEPVMTATRLLRVSSSKGEPVSFFEKRGLIWPQGDAHATHKLKQDQRDARQEQSLRWRDSGEVKPVQPCCAHLRPLFTLSEAKSKSSAACARCDTNAGRNGWEVLHIAVRELCGWIGDQIGGGCTWGGGRGG